MISALSKLSKRQPIQELAFHKEQWEINGVPFECHESYYEGELLNGIDLKIKAVRGLSNRQSTIAFLQDSQELVFAASAHLMVYNTHRRSYHQLFSLQGEVELLTTHLEKMNNREYILWVELFHDQSMPPAHTHRTKTHSRLTRRTGSLTHRPTPPVNASRTAKPLPKSIFSKTSENSFQKATAKQQADNCSHLLRVFDYTRKQFIFQGLIELAAGQTLKELFMFMNHYKIVGYVGQDYESNIRQVYYRNLEQQKNTADPFTLTEPSFASFTTQKNLERVIFNPELNHFLFHNVKTLNAISIKEDAPDADHELFKQFLSLSDARPKQERGKAVRLQVQEIATYEDEILSIAVSQQYVAVLTTNKIHFHSAFDPASLMFTHFLEASPNEPLGIEFNKSALLLTYRGIATIVSFIVKGKALRVMGETNLGLSHCKQILRIYTNNISAEAFCVVRFYELQGRDRLCSIPTASLASELLEGLVQYASKPASVDVVASFLAPAGSAQSANALGLSRRRFRRVHVCAWLSGYVVETEQAVELGGFRQSFQSKKCAVVHPTGLFLVVCFKESFRIYVITQEGFANSYRGDSLKDIQDCAISPQGNHLAVCSFNAIHIYDFYSCSRMRTLTLPFGLVIQGIQFSGHTLVCQLRSKKVYLYDSLNQYRQSYVFNPKPFLNDPVAREEEAAVSALLAMTISEIVTMVTFSPFYYCPILNFFIYSYQNTIYFFNCTTNSVHASVEIDGISCTHYCQNLATLFLGTANGDLICFPWPNKPSSLVCEHRKFKLHAERIVDIRVTSDLREIITIGEDQTLCVSSVTAVRNLKRFQGLELVEHLSGSIRICYDFLARRGLSLFTHSKMGEKNDLLKDCEDAVINANFILPQERQKQKEQMFTNVKVNMKDIAQGSQHVYEAINRSTNDARDLVDRARYEFMQFNRKRQKEKEEMKQAMYAEYIQKYNTTEASIKEQQALTLRLADQLAATKQQLAVELRQAQQGSNRKYKQLQAEKQEQMRGLNHEDPAQLLEIDAQKKEFLGANIGALDDVVSQLNNSNGVLACRNNNLQKEIADLRRKMQEHGYLLYRLEGNANKLKEEQTRYESIKAQNTKLVQRQDRINLAEIERRYVKQTQTLIQRDKEINVQLVNYSKEKNILIHLEKCLEGVQGSIETLVGNILQEKKQRKEELLLIQAAKQEVSAITADMIAAKKDKISSRNQLHNYLCKLEAVVQDALHARSKQHLQQLMNERDLIDPEPAPLVARPQEKELLSKLLSEKVQTTRPNGHKPTLLRTNTRGGGNMRTLKTEGNQGGRSGSLRLALATTCREVIEKRSREVYMKLDAEKKQYQRIKTEQLVFQNRQKKFNLENQDLIENYNSLAMDNRKFITALRRQHSVSRLPVQRQRLQRGQGNPTPFQLYLQNKANGHSQRAFVPLGSYETQH